MTDVTQDLTVDALIDAYRRFRLADSAMTLRIRSETGMTDNEIAIVRYLLHERDEDHDVKPSEIARHLDISSASTTALLDRLERSGMVERISHPTDRRSILIAATPAAEAAVASTLEAFETRLHDLSAALDPDARATVVSYLAALTEAADAIGTPRS